MTPRDYNRNRYLMLTLALGSLLGFTFFPASLGMLLDYGYDPVFLATAVLSGLMILAFTPALLYKVWKSIEQTDSLG